MRFSKTIFVFILLLLSVGCQTLAKRNSTGVIVARHAQIRSSTAVVAADLLQVNRGDVVDIVDSTDVIEESKKLAAEDKEIPAQATGQLRASANLRLNPDRSGNENIMMRLDSGSSFDIISWKRVPKPKASEAIETDVAPQAGSAQQGNARPGKQADENEPEETNELWYKVRLTTGTSPAPAGWIYGKQVELAVPSDIIFYRTGREFVAWQRLDGETNDKNDKDAGREAKPGSWLILEKSSSNDPHGLDEPDFD